MATPGPRAIDTAGNQDTEGGDKITAYADYDHSGNQDRLLRNRSRSLLRRWPSGQGVEEDGGGHRHGRGRVRRLAQGVHHGHSRSFALLESLIMKHKQAR